MSNSDNSQYVVVLEEIPCDILEEKPPPAKPAPSILLAPLTAAATPQRTSSSTYEAGLLRRAELEQLERQRYASVHGVLPPKAAPMTGAERVRAMRARRKLLQLAERTGGEGAGASGSRGSKSSRAKTAAERVREMRARKKMIAQLGRVVGKARAKTAAERMREYRARKRRERNPAGADESQLDSLER